MPPDHGDNQPLEASDHDSLIEIISTVRRLDSDMSLYRERYHDIVAPNVQHTISDVAEIKKRLDSMDKRITAGEVAKAELTDHKDECARYNRSNEGKLVSIEAKIDQNQQSLAELIDRKAEVLAQKIADNEGQRQEGQKVAIKWVAGLIFAGMSALLGILWTMLAPHLVHLPGQ